MPIYEYRCDCGETVDVLAASGAPAPACPACGAETRKLVSGFALGGRADAGVSQSRMPQTWKGTYRGNREYITSLQRQWEQRRRLEERYPELAGDRRPVVAHEGHYSAVPLRAGDTRRPRQRRLTRRPGPAIGPGTSEGATTTPILTGIHTHQRGPPPAA